VTWHQSHPKWPWYCHVSGVPWLIITGSGLDDWIYWYFYYNYTYLQSIITAHNRWLSKAHSIPTVFSPTVTDLHEWHLSYATSTHRRTFSARPRGGMCRQCARPRARNVRHSGRVRATMRLMSVFLFRVKGRSCPNTTKHERPDYWSRCVDGYIRPRMFGESFVVES
jgi:hypothetical protein